LEVGLSIYAAIFVPLIAAVIVILAADLTVGIRNIPFAGLFRAAEIVLLIAYLIYALVAFGPALMMVAWLPLSIVLPVAYLALGAAQAPAIAAGLEEWGVGSRWRSRLGALLLAYVPVLGSAFAVWGAALGWHWPARTGLIRFFGLLVAIVAPPLLLYGYIFLSQAGLLP
jgi:hypothetical protein